MPIYTNMSGSTELDNSAVLAFEAAFMVASGQDNVMDQLAQYNTVIGAKSIEMTKYARLAKAMTPLGEYDDAGRVTMADTQILFTPSEYGQAVTTTKLAALQSGGKVDLAAAQVVGINAGSTTNQLAVNALDASTNVIFAGTGTEGAVAAGDVMSPTFLNRMYNQLSRANIQKIDGMYVAVLHDDQIHDLRLGTGAGSWQDITKYTDGVTPLRNEIGMLAGFRIVSNNDIVFADQTGAGTVDVYRGLFLGANALGKAESQPLRLTLTGPFDALGRFVNLGWHWVGTYGIVDTAAVFVGGTASSVGANA